MQLRWEGEQLDELRHPRTPFFEESIEMSNCTEKKKKEKKRDEITDTKVKMWTAMSGASRAGVLPRAASFPVAGGGDADEDDRDDDMEGDFRS